jgi:hypothetical protein
MRVQQILTLLLVGSIAAGVEATAQSPGSVAEQYLFSAANVERAQRGLGLLRWDGALYRAADGHARKMAERESISHQYPGEAELAIRGRDAGARFSLIAENVAEASTAVRIHDAWMNSPEHRANLLDPQVDSVAIRVVSRAGQLYVVEDFSRAVSTLSLEEQEQRVGELLQRTSSVRILDATAQSRQTCAMESGFAGEHRPAFLMRFTSAELTRLPKELTARLATGKYSEAQVGACDVVGQQRFTTFRIVVLLYP